MSEAKIAKKIGADLVKNSGRGLRKGDMTHTRTGHKLLIDAKEGKSFTLNEKVWAKVCSDAYTWGSEYLPVILRAFDDGSMVAVISWSDLEDLMEGTDWA